ncbi:phenylacetaldoxime dehydratase family protein [Nocardioides sp. LHD-245]|uniref:phenylacetaldoxime dehydratase family protein n=1 Tax=Nocardioides sp. LHD-245 TaxID=3051387 RepID=UPI0027E05168|nr:phenylacetaldoxime dehydratase family protein [Nocardioides sp. LHD-245]
MSNSTTARERPEFDSYTGRLDADVRQVVMAYFGAQEASAEAGTALGDVLRMRALMRRPGGPGHLELSRYVDQAGCGTVLIVGYWLSPEAFDSWYAAHGASWTSGEAAIGHFVEVVRPSVRRLETIYSSNRDLQGIGTLAERPSGPIIEHGYWGGMRERMPDARDSRLASSGAPEPVVRDGATEVVPHEGLCLIRSGQDFSSTDGAERAFYLEQVEPQLRAGMDFLRDEGRSIGCFANRYVSVLGEEGERREKSYAMSWWNDMADLEGWARSHRTHVRIFGAFTAHMKRFGDDARLRLYHEVAVVPREHQFFRYSRCHEGTGMLRAIQD